MTRRAPRGGAELAEGVLDPRGGLEPHQLADLCELGRPSLLGHVGELDPADPSHPPVFVLGVGPEAVQEDARGRAEARMVLVELRSGSRPARPLTRVTMSTFLLAGPAPPGCAQVVAGDARGLVVERPEPVAAVAPGVAGHPFPEEQLAALALGRPVVGSFRVALVLVRRVASRFGNVRPPANPQRPANNARPVMPQTVRQIIVDEDLKPSIVSSRFPNEDVFRIAHSGETAESSASLPLLHSPGDQLRGTQERESSCPFPCTELKVPYRNQTPELQ